jgi:hypothetical protein
VQFGAVNGGFPPTSALLGSYPNPPLTPRPGSGVALIESVIENPSSFDCGEVARKVFRQDLDTALEAFPF